MPNLFSALKRHWLPVQIAVLLAVGAWMAQPSRSLPPVYAESDFSYMFIDPGTTILRDPDTGAQIQGKVMIDRRNGDVWGFPTASSAPYPVVQSYKEPPLSKTLYLGRFDFSAMRRK